MAKLENLVVKVTNTHVEVLHGELNESWLSQIPRDDNEIYQLRPVAKKWESDNESGSYCPIFGWATGELPENEWPNITDLPTIL